MTDTATKVYSSMEEILASGASEVEYAEVPGFREGEIVRIGSVDAGAVIEWSEANETEAKRTAGLRLITKSLVNEAGVRYADDVKNIPKLRAMRHKETERIVKAILKLNGMNVDAEVKKD